MSEFIEPRTKIHLLDKGCACVPKTKSFTEDPKEEIWGKPKVLGLGGVLKVSYHFYYPSRGRVLSYFGLFLPLGCEGDVWTVVAGFMVVKGLFG